MMVDCFVIWKVTVQCHTWALYSHHVFYLLVVASLPPPAFPSTTPSVIIMYRPDRHPHHQNVAQPWRGVAPLALRLYPLWFHLPQLLRPEEGLALLHASLHIFEARVKMLGELFGVAPPRASARDVYERFWRSPPIASSRALAGVVAASSFCLPPPSISGVILSIATVTEGFFLSSLE